MSRHEGSCLCEGVQFAVEGEPEKVFICYCSHCTKNAGGPGQIVRATELPNTHRGVGILSDGFADGEIPKGTSESQAGPGIDKVLGAQRHRERIGEAQDILRALWMYAVDHPHESRRHSLYRSDFTDR